ncbi:Uncharacterised protein [Actinomyces bovis]|uniref:Uncharacterized protein n=1 Tax=Actinomyces bovis TaxID=1658 RepID=A0ABY1VP85_9ACTO|nr:hypothetical protein [Actinomyces bovis]SPT53795.1 Uncharacterised protein [Actinomyces bovis]VEG53150.1 Uncharacterised protein [Actinomyces israelii]
MTALTPYDVVVNGCRTTLLLTEADAAAWGLTPRTQPKPETESRTRTSRNKAANPSNK